MMLPLLPLFLFALLQVAFAEPGADASLAASLPSDHVFMEKTGLAPTGNATHDRLRLELVGRVNEIRGCEVARRNVPELYMECTEWCDLDGYGKKNVLRYHVRLSGIGVDTTQWCDFLEQAINLECGWKRPFWHCNYEGPDTRAPLDPKLGTWFVNTDTGKVERTEGVNLRFDWWGWWEPSDAMHNCVAGGIRLATCRGIRFTNGRHCIPVLHSEPEDGFEYHNEFVKPDGCHWASEVPPESG